MSGRRRFERGARLAMTVVGIAVMVGAWFADDALAGKRVVVRQARPANRQPAQRPTVQRQPVGDLSSSVSLPHDSDLRRQVDQARQSIEAKQYVPAVLALGKMLARPAVGDSFLDDNRQQATQRSFRSEVQRLIAELPTTAREAYEVNFGSDARHLLDEGVAEGDPLALQQVVQRYINTTAGREALLLLADDFREHGRPNEALRLVDRLVEFDPALADDKEIVVRRVVCAARTGQAERASELLTAWRTAHPREPLTLPGAGLLPEEVGSDTWTQWLAKLASSTTLPMASARTGWLVHRGGPTRNARVPAQRPLLAPRWYHEVASNFDFIDALASEARTRAIHGVAPMVALEPLIVDGQVLLRTLPGLQAFDLATGTMLWEYTDPCRTAQAADAFADLARGPLASDGQRVFLIEDVSGTTRVAFDENGGNMVPGTTTNILSALAVSEGRQGNLVWQIGGTDGGGQPDLAGVFFLGAPLPAGGRLYAIVEQKNSIRLLVLDAATGEVDWSQDLALVEQSIGYDAVRQASGSSPTLVEDVLICPTSRGGVVAVDLTLRTLLWAYLYPAPQIVTYGNVVPELQPQWLDATVAAAEGAVIVAPPEGDLLHCLEVRTGECRWTQPRDEGCYVACIDDGHVVVIGAHKVKAFNLADGKPSWKPIELPNTALPAGRGVYAAGRYFLPLSNRELYELDLAEGTIIEQLRSPRELTLGNLVWHDGTFVSQGREYLQVFDEQTLLDERVTAALAHNPRDAEALLRKADLETAAQRPDQALEALRTAHAVAGTASTRSRLSAALFDAIRRDAKHRERYDAEIDALVLESSQARD